LGDKNNTDSPDFWPGLAFWYCSDT